MDATLSFGSVEIELMLVLLFAGVLTTVLLIGFAVIGFVANPRKRLNERLARVKAADSLPSVNARAGIKLDTSYSSIQSFDRLLRKFLPRPALMRQRLAKAGLPISLGAYVLVNLIVGAVTALAVYYLLKMPVLVLFLAGLAVGVGLPHIVVSFLIARRTTKFITIFPEAIDLIVRGLRSGLPVTESIRTVGREMPSPVGPEFDLVADALKFGKTLDEALWTAAKRIDTPEFKFFIIALSIQQETGGNLAETLDNLSDILRKRKQMRLKVKAMSSEARASAMIIGSLPFVMFAIINAVNPRYLSLLFNDPRGLVATSLGLILMLVGAGVMYKMVKFEA